jgi:hypothetical protein
VTDNLPDGIILPPAAIASSLKVSRASGTTSPVSVPTASVKIRKAPFIDRNNSVCRQELSDRVMIFFRGLETCSFVIATVVLIVTYVQRNLKQLVAG